MMSPSPSNENKRKCPRRAIIFVVWGESKYLRELDRCLRLSKSIHDYDLFLITDEQTDIEDFRFYFKKVIRVAFEWPAEIRARKIEFFRYLPGGYDSFLYLDCDTIILKDISLGFEKAEKFGIAMVSNNGQHLEGGQQLAETDSDLNTDHMLLNAGIIFFSASSNTVSILEYWALLTKKYSRELNDNDQISLWVTMQKLDINPYILPGKYNRQCFRSYRRWSATRSDICILHTHQECRLIDGEIIVSADKFTKTLRIIKPLILRKCRTLLFGSLN